jgi:hypothetical protein
MSDIPDFPDALVERILAGVADETKDRFPLLAQALVNLGQRLRLVIHELDWDISGDKPILDAEAYELIALTMLTRAAGDVLASLP